MTTHQQEKPKPPPISETEISFEEVKSIIDGIGHRPMDLIPILLAIQDKYNYLPRKALKFLCEYTQITAADIEGVSTFYSLFRHKPVGKHIIKTCIGTACHVAGAKTIYEGIRYELKIEGEEITNEDGTWTTEEVACLGCCMLAPVVQIDDVTYGHVKNKNVPKMLSDFLETQFLKEKEEDDLENRSGIGEVRICQCSSCVASGSKKLHDEVKHQIKSLGLPAQLKKVGCNGLSYQAPMMTIKLDGFNQKEQREHKYGRVKLDDVQLILTRHFRPASMVQKVLAQASKVLNWIYTDEAWEGVTKYAFDVRSGADGQFVGKQVQIVTEHSGKMSPLDLDEYLRLGGFQALKTCLTKHQPKEVIDIIEASGLRGRGGGGFPTHQKWRFVADAKGTQKYIICNGDEGDPGAFMDRMILESFPFRVLEGMTLAAKAIGIHEGFLYIRAEYPLAMERIEAAITLAEERGLLGENILGSGFDLKLKVVKGAGAFVCGEETALISSIEGGRGMPTIRPPYPAIEGLWGKPTLINNVETFANLSWIIRNGPEKFAAMGRGKSRGSKTFALAGKVRRGGLIEVPMGMTIREIVEEVGGGVPHGKSLKGVLIGGPSGGVVPEHLCDTPVDFEELKKIGGMMGSGGMVVLDEDDCVLDITRYFMQFLKDESCGKCTHCRVGTYRMWEILEKFCQGKGKAADLKVLDELSEITKAGSLCGLGQTAPNPLLTSIRFFREEYEAHLEGKCPAKVCKPLIDYHITDTCFGCTICSQNCPTEAIPMTPYLNHHIELDKCTSCDICLQVCPVNAIVIRSGKDWGAPIETDKYDAYEMPKGLSQ